GAQGDGCRGAGELCAAPVPADRHRCQRNPNPPRTHRDLVPAVGSSRPRPEGTSRPGIRTRSTFLYRCRLGGDASRPCRPRGLGEVPGTETGQAARAVSVAAVVAHLCPRGTFRIHRVTCGSSTVAARCSKIVERFNQEGSATSEIDAMPKSGWTLIETLEPGRLT